MGHLLPFYPSNNPENQSFEKMKKMPGDIIILDMCTINDDHMMYGSWDMECDRQNFLPCPFTPEQPVKSKFWKNGKKFPGDIILLHMCTINDDHMMYGFWEMECDRQNFLSFRSIFCPFTPLTTCKIKILEKWKKHQEVWSFYTCVPWMTIIGCMVLDIWKVTVRIIWHFGPFFCSINPVTTQEIKILKKWKKHLEILSIYSCLPKWQSWYTVHEIWSTRDRTFCHFGPFFALLPFYSTKTLKNQN